MSIEHGGGGKPDTFLNKIPGSIKFVIVSTSVAAGWIAAGIPGAVTMVTLEGVALIVIKSNQKKDSTS